MLALRGESVVPFAELALSDSRVGRASPHHVFSRDQNRLCGMDLALGQPNPPQNAVAHVVPARQNTLDKLRVKML
jgi:hypothetical protein